MRVAMLAPIAWRTPPRAYGPWELVTSLLTEALVARGIEVTLFATADSVTTAQLSAIVPRPYNDDPDIDAKVWEYRHLAHCFSRADQFDIIHNQADFPAHAFADLVETPIITTIHGLSSAKILPMYEPFNDLVHYVSISEADRHPALRYTATIHHGIDVEAFPFHPRGPKRLLFFGRIHPDKGAAAAIAVARDSGYPLDLYGIVQDDRYYENEIEPALVDPNIVFHGVVGGHERLRALGEAHALMHLIEFDEPFGLSVIEAMACGTPVIANARGSMRELIEDGLTGFLVHNRREALEAIPRVEALDRGTIRKRVGERFSIERMADAYIAVYRRIIGAG